MVEGMVQEHRLRNEGTKHPAQLTAMVLNSLDVGGGSLGGVSAALEREDKTWTNGVTKGISFCE